MLELDTGTIDFVCARRQVERKDLRVVRGVLSQRYGGSDIERARQVDANVISPNGVLGKGVVACDCTYVSEPIREVSGPGPTDDDVNRRCGSL